jgi:hypothetical protein
MPDDAWWLLIHAPVNRSRQHEDGHEEERDQNEDEEESSKGEDSLTQIDDHVHEFIRFSVRFQHVASGAKTTR